VRAAARAVGPSAVAGGARLWSYSSVLLRQGSREGGQESADVDIKGYIQCIGKDMEIILGATHNWRVVVHFG